MDKTLLIFTPGCLFDKKHLLMLKTQSLLKKRLQKYLNKKINVISALVYDRVDSEYEHSQQFDFDIIVNKKSVENYTSKEYPNCGIRRPTNYVISELAKSVNVNFDSLYMLRHIQDTFVNDIKQFSSQIEHLILSEKHCFLAGRIAESTIDSHYLPKMGLKTVSKIKYVYGEIMLAKWETWNKYYLGIPNFITHYTDDVMMSEWMNQDEGVLIEISKTWDHLHGCQIEKLKSIYKKHEEELKLSVL